MKSVHFLVAALLLVASPFALAGKPSQDQVINSGPVWQGNLISCWVSNTTDTDIIADITIYYVDNKQVTQVEEFLALSIGPNSVIHRSKDGSNRGGYCKINWTGHVGELRGTFCGFYVDDQVVPQVEHFLGCSDAY